MHLEVGKYYRTRGGRKAVVSAIVPPSPDGKSAPYHPVKGYVLIGDKWNPASWTMEGREVNERDSVHDLVAPWIDPPEVKIELAERDSHPRVLVTIGERVFAYDYRGKQVCLVLSRDAYTNIRPYEPASRDA